MKLKRALSLILVLAMVIPLMLPSGGLTVVANAVEASEIESYVSSQQGFTIDQYETLKAYYDTCTANGWTTDNVPSLERLEAAVEALAAGADYYDDFQVLGTYLGESETVDTGDTTIQAGIEPENPGDLFPTETNTTNYEIIWGGVVAQRYTSENCPSELRFGYTSTWPYVISSAANNMGSHHVYSYWFEGCEYNKNYIHGENANYCKVGTYEDTLGLYNNWITMKADALSGAEELPVFSLTVKGKTYFPRIVYNWIDINNYNYVETNGGYTELYAVEIKDGVKTSKRIGANGQGLHNATGWNDSPNPAIEFNFVWNPTKGCYVLTLVNATNPTLTYSVDLPTTENEISMVDNVRFSVRPDVGGNAKANIFNSFVDISFSTSIPKYIDNRIANEVPQVADVKRTDLATLKSLLEEINGFGQEIVAQVTDMQKLTDAIAQAELLQAEYETTFRVDDTLTFEEGNELEWADYFAEPGGIEIVDNPYQDSMNPSDKVMWTRRTTKSYMESLAGNIYSVTGKTTNCAFYIIEGSSYVNFSLGTTVNYTDTLQKVVDYVNMQHGAQKDGEGVSGMGAYGGDRCGMPEGVTLASKWINFAIRRVGATYTLEYSVLGSDGNYYYNTKEVYMPNTTSGNAVLQMAGNGYVDDLTVTLMDTDAYYEADGFMTANAEILDLFPYDRHLSAIDQDRYQAMLEHFDTLSQKAKAALGDSVLVKVELIRQAMAAIDPTVAAADEKYYGYAQESYTLNNTVYGRRYRAFTSADNDDSLSQWKVASALSGHADVVEDSDLGRNVIQLNREVSLILRTEFIPEKANLSEFSYYIEPADGSLTAIRHWSDNKVVATPQIKVYTYYKDSKNYQYYGLGETSAMLYTCTNGTTGRANGFTYADTGSGLFNPANGVQVDIVYSNNKAKLTLTDSAGDIIDVEQSVNKDAKNIPIISITTGGGWRAYNICDFYCNVRDIAVKFAQGDWDEDVTQSKLNVSYTGNTYQSPGDVAVIRGENLGALVGSAKIIQITDTDTTTPGYIDRTSYDYAGVEDGEFTVAPTTPNIDWSRAVNLEFIRKSTDSVQFIIPEDFTHGIYAVQLKAVIAGQVQTRVVYLNAPVIDFYLGSDGEMASPGTELEIVGENMAPNQNANEDAVAYDLRTKDRDPEDVKVMLIKADGSGERYELEIKEITSDYNIVAMIPSEIEVADDGSTSDWELYVYNGYGDGTCWSIPKIIKIGRALSELRPTNYIDIRTYGATCGYTQDATHIIQEALVDLEAMGGGTLYLPEGHYRLSYTIYVPDNITIQGDGKALTNFVPTYVQHGYGKLPVYTGFVLGDNCTVDGVAFYLKRCRRVLSAATTLDNVTINDVKFYTNYTSWANNSLGQGGNLVDRFDMYKYNESQNEDNAFIWGSFRNLKLTNVLADMNVNGVSLMNCYSSVCEYGRFENITYDSGNDIGWLRALFSSAVWKNCDLARGTATQARGVYMYECSFGPHPGYNRELWVADLAGNGSIRYQLITDPENGITEENTVYIKVVGSLDVRNDKWLADGNYQAYVVSGNGAGQTVEFVGVDYERNCLIMAEPMQVPLNRNSVVTTRQPREDIYFVDCDFYEGGCPGGFFGGCADVIHDGDHMNYAFNQYYMARTYDVNWYCSMINSVWENTPYSLIAAYGMKQGGSYSFSEDGSNLDNAQLGILIRNNVVDNMPISFSGRSSGKVKDFIVDNNVFDGMKYIMGSDKSSVPDGLTFYRNTGDELVAYFGDLPTPKGTNSLGYTYVTYLDEQGNETSTLLGDVNMDGQITLKDVTVIHYAVVGEITLTETQILLGDVDGNGVITAVDATYIRNYLLSAIDKFPAEPEPSDPDATEGTTTEATTTKETLDMTAGTGTGENDTEFSPGFH